MSLIGTIRPSGWRSFLPFSCVLLAAAFAAGASAQPQPGDYGSVADILDGRRILMQTDDLVAVSMNGGATVFDTKDGSVGGTTETTWGTPIFHNESGRAAAGRFFDFPNDVIATAVAGPRSNEIYIGMYNPADGKRQMVDLPYNESRVLAFRAADLDHDGIDEMLLVSVGQGGVPTLRVIKAFDPHDAQMSGLQLYGHAATGWITSDTMAVGDFFGDGKLEIVGVAPQASGKGLRLLVHTVDASSLMISDATSVPLTLPEGDVPIPVALLGLASGHFTSASHDDLLVAYAADEGTLKVKLLGLDESKGAWSERTSWDSKVKMEDAPDGRDDYYRWGFVRVRAGRSNWGSALDDAMYVLYGGNYHRYAGSDSYAVHLSSLALQPSPLTLTEARVWDSRNPYGSVIDLVLGDFDFHQADPQSPGQSDRVPHLRPAILTVNSNGDEGYVSLFDVDQNGALAPVASPVSFPHPSKDPFSGLVAGDAQGRSVRLGEPTKATINDSTQVTVAIAAPPMHVDFIVPDGKTEAELLNVTVIPDEYNTKYETSSSTAKSSTTKHSTSWSFAGKEKFSFGYEIGSVKEGEGFKASVTTKFMQDRKGDIEKSHGTFSETEIDVKQVTGFSDSYWAERSRFTIWMYEVIGQKACPRGKKNCADSEKVPVMMQFSAPDQIAPETGSASGVEWYQPPWEYGNLFSYPGSFSQLLQIYPDLEKLSTDLTWKTDKNEQTQTTTFTVKKTDGTSTSYDWNNSYDVDTACAGAFEGFFGSAKVSLGGSDGYSDLNKSSVSLAKSDGISVRKPNTFADPNAYQYRVTPYIFGKKRPESARDESTPASDLQTFGALRTAFVVDPVTTTAGWWRQTYTKAPDIALNHPNRWQVDAKTLEDKMPANCLPLSSSSSPRMDCVTLSSRSPENPWMSEVHDMRGFFITDADSPGKGPQLERCDAGTTLKLQARVYNYSLAAMKPEARVHVRFYGMPWNPQTSMPLGPSFRIGEDVLEPIPPFSTDEGAPLNWRMASATLDETKSTNLSGQFVVFWVMAWGQDDASLVAELPGHGLRGVPKDNPGLDFANACELEEPYSNNVGIYRVPFHFDAPRPGLLSGGAEEVRVAKVAFDADRMALGDHAQLSVLLTAGAAGASGVTVVFYDGDPAHGGRSFDVERVPMIAPGGSHLVRVWYRPRDCGMRRVWVSVGRGKPFAVTVFSPELLVRCDRPSPAMPAARALAVGQ